jgi:hypothetical protein
LKGGRGIAQPKEHDLRLEESEFSLEHRFPAVVRVDEDIVVSPSDIHLGEVLGVSEFSNEGRDHWQGKRIGVLYSPFVDVAIVQRRSHWLGEISMVG